MCPAACSRSNPKSGLSTLMRRIVRAQVAEARQLDHGLAAIERHDGVAMAQCDLDVALQIRERLPFQVKLVVARNEVRDQVLPAHAMRRELRQVMTGAAGHGMART